MFFETRSQLTSIDFQFIAQTIGQTPQEQSAILHLTEDPYTLTELLRHRRLMERSMTPPPVFLSISPQLFFFIVIYQALDRKKIADDDVVDYIAGICVEFRSNEALWHLEQTKGGRMFYLVDVINLMSDLNKHQRYILRRHVGNVTLFLTSFFPDFIFQRSRKKGAPSIDYYEKIGRSQYESAADESQMYDAIAAPVLNALAERFVAIRSAINIFNDTYLHLNSRKHTLGILERQAATLDEESFRQSIC